MAPVNAQGGPGGSAASGPTTNPAALATVQAAEIQALKNQVAALLANA